MPAPPMRISHREFVLMMALITAMAALAIDMLLPAFSDMRQSFGLSPDSTQLSVVISLFFVGLAIGTPFFGPISDAIGRKRALYLSLSIYAIGSAVTAFAPNLAVLYLGRVIWGIGAAGPSTLSQAILSDRFSGDQLSRMMALVRAVFYLGPVLAPLLGGAILVVAPWRVVASVGLLTAIAIGLWLTRLSEPLAEEDRQPLGFRETTTSIGIVLHTRQSLGMSLAIMFGFGSFLSFLGSSELILDSVFGRGNVFVIYFSITGVLYGVTAFSISRLVQYMDSRRVLKFAAGAHVIGSLGMLTIALASQGTPGFWVWIPVFTAANCAFLAMEPIAYSLALSPLGGRAGTASAVVQFMSSAFGALLAWFIDRAIDGSVLPQGYGYAIYSSLAFASVMWGLGRSPRSP